MSGTATLVDHRAVPVPTSAWVYRCAVCGRHVVFVAGPTALHWRHKGSGYHWRRIR